MMYHTKKKRISELSESTKQKLRQKLCRMQKTLESQFTEATAPGQSEEFIENILHANTEEGKTETIPDGLQVEIKMYKDCDSLAKHVILCLINHSKCSKEQTMNFFQCSRWEVDQAKKLQAQSCFTVPHKQKLRDQEFHKKKLNISWNFNVILTMRYNHTLSHYKKFCLDIGYEPISDSSCWRILKGINPSQKKALAGLDDMTAAGMNGFTTLSKVR